MVRFLPVLVRTKWDNCEPGKRHLASITLYGMSTIRPASGTYEDIKDDSSVEGVRNEAALSADHCENGSSLRSGRDHVHSIAFSRVDADASSVVPRLPLGRERQGVWLEGHRTGRALRMR